MRANIYRKARYLAASAVNYLLPQRQSCPSCAGRCSKLVERKWLVTALRRCESCGLLFRVPTTSPAESLSFYQSNYKEGFTTELPNDAELEDLLRVGFKNTEKDYETYLKILRAVGARPGDRVIDFGCSWGYGSWQLKQAGYHVQSLEVSTERCHFAKSRLNIDAHDSINQLEGRCDYFFSAHVIEHVPSVANFVSTARSLLRVGGIAIIFTPNASMRRRQLAPKNFHLLWGLAHPQLIDEIYLDKAFLGSEFLITTSPYDLDTIQSWSRGTAPKNRDLTGEELLLLFKKLK